MDNAGVKGCGFFRGFLGAHQEQNVIDYRPYAEWDEGQQMIRIGCNINGQGWILKGDVARIIKQLAQFLP